MHEAVMTITDLLKRNAKQKRKHDKARCPFRPVRRQPFPSASATFTSPTRRATCLKSEVHTKNN